MRTNHPVLGGLLLGGAPEPQSTKAWPTGAEGEERLGRRLDELVSPTVQVLHDRRIPGTRANLDHLVITPLGVTIIDTKRLEGYQRTLYRMLWWSAACAGTTVPAASARLSAAVARSLFFTGISSEGGRSNGRLTGPFGPN